MMPDKLTKEKFAGLSTAAHPDAISTILVSLSQSRLPAVAMIKQYHDLLLFNCAFPHDKKTYRLAMAALHRIAATVKNTIKTNHSNRIALMASGIAHSELFCAYSLSIARWLMEKFPDGVEFDSGEASIETVRNTLQLLLPKIEFEKATQGEYSLSKRIQMLSAKNRTGTLHWLLKAFDESKLQLGVKDELYRQLKIFIRWKLSNEPFSRTFLRLPVKAIYYQEDFIKNPDSSTLIKQRLTKPLKLSLAQKITVLDTMKASLALLSRETDPVSFADTDELDLFDLGRGTQVALVGMNKERRLSLESYIGFMAFKNGIPIAYGGGWIWGYRCKIGINIYAPFRKGESAWLFYQVLRVYYQYYHVRHFVVNPYQFGKGNPEGLKSGAFWFYYKAGFRPEKGAIKKAADKEWKKIQEDKHYRTPLVTLRQFTGCYAEWITDKTKPPILPATDISAAISSMINLGYKGSRKNALAISNKFLLEHFPSAFLKSWRLYEQEAMDNWSLLTLLIKDCKTWSTKEKKGLVQIMLLKLKGKERDYILQLQKHKRFWRALQGADQYTSSH